MISIAPVGQTSTQAISIVHLFTLDSLILVSKLFSGDVVQISKGHTLIHAWHEAQIDVSSRNFPLSKDTSWIES
jgi:hypothetical protein